MKVIDLLNKIANGEEVPKKIKFENEVYVLDHEGLDFYALEEGYGLLLEKINDTNLLNVEVEIIEEKPKHIEEINKSYPIFNFDEKSFEAMKDMLQDVYSKQVKIIKAVNYLLDKEER